MADNSASVLDTLIDAALPHVAFDGWSDRTWAAALRDSGVDPAVSEGVAPRRAVDLALAFHRRGDRRMIDALAAEDLSALRFRDRVARAVRLRIEAAEDREAVRRGTTLFALPQNAALGARALWDTADAIWTALGDRSDDLNWYTKRATLSGVLSATVLYWLGDGSPGARDTWAFLDRRIDDVMRVENLKAKARKTPVVKQALAMHERLFGFVKPPKARTDVPGVRTAGDRP